MKDDPSIDALNCSFNLFEIQEIDDWSVWTENEQIKNFLSVDNSKFVTSYTMYLRI